MSEGTTTHDVIVIGSGSGGSAVTRRLVDGGLDVLMLEAGAIDENPAIHDPRRSHELWGSAEDWNYQTTPQQHANGRSVAWPRGKVLGGSSSLNGMIYTRGSRADFDTWAYLGNEGWSYDDVLPIFKRSEDFDAGASEHHGVGGPLHITSRFEPNVVHQAIVEAAQQAGLAFNPDYNGPELDGVSFMQFTIKDGRRFNTGRAFLDPIATAENFTIHSGARAHRLLFEGSRCTGVEYEQGGAMVRAYAEREVVVAAGVVESPKLLMLSGVGPAAHLRSVGIDVRVDLPGVGENLHDHAVCPVIFTAKAPIPKGPAGVPEMQSHLFWRSRSGLPGPDVQPIHFTTPRYEPWMEGPADGFTLHAGLIRPASRGTVRLASGDVDTPPLIDPHLLAAEIDLDTLVASLELNREIAHQEALSGWLDRELYPGPQVRSAPEVRDYIRSAVGSYHHQVGTCKMGVDELAVVDPSLRVRGIEGLRIADASVMPHVTSGNTHAPTIMIGERAADFILAEAATPAAG